MIEPTISDYLKRYKNYEDIYLTPSGRFVKWSTLSEEWLVYRDKCPCGNVVFRGEESELVKWLVEHE